MKAKKILKVFSVLTICAATYYLFNICYSWIDPKENIGSIIIFSTIGICLCLAVIYLGYSCLRKATPKAVRRLVALYCFYIIFYGFHFTKADKYLRTFFPEDISFSISFFAAIILIFVSYWFLYRFCLRALHFECPPIRQSLSKAPIFLISIFTMSLSGEIMRYLFPVVKEENHFIESPWFLVSIATPLILAISIYKLGVWLFVKQEEIKIKDKFIAD